MAEALTNKTVLKPIQYTQRYPREVLLAIGGWHQGSPTNHIEIFDLRVKKWSVITHLPEFISETPRAYHSIGSGVTLLASRF